MAQYPYEAIHATAVEQYFPELCHVRNRYASEGVPVTFTPHTLSYWACMVRHPYKVLTGAQSYDSIFCTSRAAKIHYEQVFSAAAEKFKAQGLVEAGTPVRLDICPLGVRCNAFGDETRDQARIALKLPKDSTIFLCVGRLNPEDKFDLAPLVAALAGISPGRDVCLVLAGAEYRGYGRFLANLASGLGLAGKVHLFTDFNEDQKALIYAAADAFVSPADNLQETFGLSIIEAMAAGLPVVASDFDGYRDLVVHDRTGYLIPTTGPDDFSRLDGVWPVLPERVSAFQVAQRTAVDLDSLMQSMAALADSRDLRLRMGEAGRQRAETLYDWPVVIHRMETLWRRLKTESLNQPRTCPDHLLDLDRGRLFGHFYTNRIVGSDRIGPGPMASLYESGRWGAPLADAGIDPRALKSLLQIVTTASAPLPVADINKVLPPDLPSFMVYDLVLWGLKYGLLSKRSA